MDEAIDHEHYIFREMAGKASCSSFWELFRQVLVFQVMVAEASDSSDASVIGMPLKAESPSDV